MRWMVAAGIVLLGTQPVIAGPLEEALALVLSKSAAVRARQHETEVISQQSTWSSEVRLAYHLKQTQENASGIDAGITVKIPLFDRSKEIAAAKARYQLAETRQTLQSALVAVAAQLVELAVKQADAIEVAEFQRDKLEYYKQAVDEGREEAEVLWQVAKSVRDAQQASVAAVQTFDTELEKMARTYGGKEWMTLQDLLAAYVRQKMHSTPSAGAATSW